MVGFDATVLTMVLNPQADSPPDPMTGAPVDRANERVEFLIASLQKAKQKIVIPTPVLSEVLVRSGNAGLQYVEVLQKAATFSIEPFDKRAAIELALMNQRAVSNGDKRGGENENWQKIKLDRQIVAICKVAGVRAVYTTDGPLGNFARLAGMDVIGIHNLPLPPEPPQLNLDLLFEPRSPPEGLSDEPKPDEIEPDEPEEDSISSESD